MITNNFNTELNAPIRKIQVKAVLNGTVFTSSDNIAKIEISRVAESGKFFGGVVGQKLSLVLLDVNRELAIEPNETIAISFTMQNGSINFPTFYASEINRDENTNAITITAYDNISTQGTVLTFADLALEAPYTVEDVAIAIATAITPVGVINKRGVAPSFDGFALSYSAGANYDGAESLRDILEDIAEVTNSYCYINHENKLTFKYLNSNSTVDYTISRSQEITISSSTNRRLTGVASTTQLSDNVGAETEQTGTTQYIYDNGFLTLRTDIDTILTDMIADLRGFTINQFDLSWSGNPAVEIGDLIQFVGKDGNNYKSIVVDDVISYSGALSQKTQWKYPEIENTMLNSADLGEALLRTYARVNKADREITLLVSSVDDIEENISQIQLDVTGINQSVSETREDVDELTQQVVTIQDRVNTQVTPDDVKFIIENTRIDEASSVTTATGFTFNENGLTISKNTSDLETTIDEDGMTISKQGSVQLTVDNVGVSAVNLKADTYLIIGKYSRFEDYQNSRTGCFWLGGE